MKLADIWQNLPPARLVEALFAIENIWDASRRQTTDEEAGAITDIMVALEKMLCDAPARDWRDVAAKVKWAAHVELTEPNDHLRALMDSAIFDIGALDSLQPAQVQHAN